MEVGPESLEAKKLDEFEVIFRPPFGNDDFVVWRDMVLDYEPEMKNSIMSTWERLTTNPDLHAYFLEVEGRVVGFVHLVTQQAVFRDSPDRLLSDLYIRPNERRKGYAHKALETIIQSSREDGYVVLHWISHVDSDARKLYDKFTPSDYAYYFHPLQTGE